MIFKSIWHKIMQGKVIGIMLNLIIVGMVATLFLLAYWGFRPYDIIDYRIDNFEMQKDEYEVGEPLTYRTSFCKSGHYTATAIRTIRDGVIYLYPTSTSRSEEGCYDFISVSTETPNVPTGEYIFRQEVVYNPNPIREISYTMESNPFMIINNN